MILPSRETGFKAIDVFYFFFINIGMNFIFVDFIDV